MTIQSAIADIAVQVYDCVCSLKGNILAKILCGFDVVKDEKTNGI